MTDIVKRLQDLLLQATTERSHYYVAKCCRDSIAEFEHLRGLLREAVNGEVEDVADWNRRARAAIKSSAHKKDR
jgi:hypothetical protein